MLHPLMIGIVTVNTSMTVIYWAFLFGDIYIRWLDTADDKPKDIYSMDSIAIVYSEPVQPVQPAEHTFYFGIHPLSWFILITNVTIGVLEWYYILSRKFCKPKEKKEEESEEKVRVEVEEDDDDDDDD
ncbi:unnamed protein product [Merluccius merluccius]